jgi:hypothetical protein
LTNETPGGPARNAYEFVLSKRGKLAVAVCVWRQIEHSALGADAERELARVMVRAGAPDGDVVRGGMRKRSLYEMAARRRKITSTWYGPHPKAGDDPLVMRVVAEQRALAASRRAAWVDTNAAESRDED